MGIDLLTTSLHRDYWYLMGRGDGSLYTDRDERGFVVRQNMHRANLLWDGLDERSVLVNCCRKRHKVTLTAKGRLVFHAHPKGLKDLAMMAKWGSDARLGCLDTKLAWVSTLQSDDGGERKKLPKEFQESSRCRRDLHTKRNRFYQDVAAELHHAWPPVGERWHSPVVTWNRQIRVRDTHGTGDPEWKFYGTVSTGERLRRRASDLYHGMVKTSAQQNERTFLEPGNWKQSLKSWWREVYRYGLHEAVFLGTGERAPIYGATPIGNGVFTVLIGTGYHWGTPRQQSFPRWGMARWDGEQFVVSDSDTPTYEEK